MNPDPELQQREDAKEKQKLATVKASLTPEELQQIIENARLLKARQEAPDSPEALATIPSLKISDLDTQIRRIPIAVSELQETNVLCHDLLPNNITYMDL